MVIGATHTPSSRLYSPPNFISIPPQRPSSRWTTASHSKPELSLFPHSKILEKRPKLSKSFIKSSGLTPRLLQAIEVSTKCRVGGAISLGACTAIGQPPRHNRNSAFIRLSTEVSPQSTLTWDSTWPLLLTVSCSV